MATEGTKFQINYKLNDGTLINLYAASVTELETGLTDLAMNASLIKSTAADLSGVTVPLTQTAQAAAVVANAFPGATPVAETPSCSHGPMNHRSGVGAKGPWQGWMCSGPKELSKEQKCQTIWIK